MMILKRKQVVILALILLIVVVGYLQYSYRQGSTSADNGTDTISDAVYVDNQVEDQGLTGTQTIDGINSQDEVTASKMANDFFAQAKMDRDQTRSKTNASLKEITEDVNADKDVKTEAYDEMMTIISNSDKEMRIETLVDKMGFSDCVALFGDDGSIDIIVKTPSLSSAQTAQIADAVSRQADISIDKIHIKKLF